MAGSLVHRFRRRVAVLAGAAVLAAAAFSAGCGAKFELPTEQKNAVVIPSDGSYQMLATWSNMQGIQDLLLTHGSGSQLFLLFQLPGEGTSPRGGVIETARSAPRPIRTDGFQGLFNPTALAAGGEAAGQRPNRIFVLDQGDTCLARQNPITFRCDTTGRFNLGITHPEYYWKVREYDLTGTASYGTFSDTTLAFVWGIAADDRGNVYVSGKAIIYLPNPFDPRLQERVFQDRIYRYHRGALPGGQRDRNILSDSLWHRDPDFAVLPGTGLGTVVEPRGMDWSPTSGPALFVADFGKNWVQKMADGNENLGQSSYYRDGDLENAPELSNPTDVVVDADGFFYAVDQGNQRVTRYSDTDRTFVQIVNVENNASGLPILRPVAVAADGDLVYIADRDRNEVIRYRRRP